MNRNFYKLAFLLVQVNLFFSLNVHAFQWGPFRGVTAQSGISEKDVFDLSRTGANLLRIGFVRHPLMEKEPPYNINDKEFIKLDQILSWCETYGINVVVDPHAIPGTVKSTTTSPDDAIWTEKKYRDALVHLWGYIARRYSGRAVIVGYDLLNEPHLNLHPGSNQLTLYKELLHELIDAIRLVDKNTPIIVEPPVGHGHFGKWVNRFEGLNYLDRFSDAKIVYSPHIYEPFQFTHQGIKGKPTGIKYPGEINGKFWNKQMLSDFLGSSEFFKNGNSAAIYIGEFSAARWSGSSGDNYIADLIEIFEQNNWSWSYHAWREASVWDSEVPNYNREIIERSAQAPRLNILRKYFALNQK